jgi:hypothetical protein
MTRSTRRINLFLTLAALGLAWVAVERWAIATDAMPQPSPTPDQALLTSEEMNILRQADVPIAIPTVIPPGFQLDYVESSASSGGPGSSRGYLMTYRQPQLSGTGTACFEIEASTGGFGGPVPEQQVTIDPPPIAQSEATSYHIFWTDTGALGSPFPEPVLFSDWIEGHEGVFYRLSSRLHMPRYCDLLSPEVAHQVLDSLRYVE